VKVLIKLLLVIYSLVIVGFGFLELGHELMHTFKKNIHYHHHDARDHRLKDHHEPVDVAITDNNLASMSSFYTYFLFFETGSPIIAHLPGEKVLHDPTRDLSTSFSPTPPVPPPLRLHKGKFTA
jgi:hypothetical protein